MAWFLLGVVLAVLMRVLARRARADDGDKVSTRWLTDYLRLRRE